MSRPAAFTALFASMMLFGTAASAGTEFYKCADEQGHVTLTDQPCGAGSQLVAASAAEQAVNSNGNIGLIVNGRRLASAPLRKQGFRLPSTPPHRGMTLDAATLKEARLNLGLLDEAASSTRQKRLAGLN